LNIDCECKNNQPHLKLIAILPGEMFLLKNCHVPELSVANCHAKLSHSKQLLKNIHPVTLAQFCSLMKNIFSYLQYLHQKPQRIANCAQLQQR